MINEFTGVDVDARLPTHVVMGGVKVIPFVGTVRRTPM
jgi:hypothetical protein